MGPPIIHLHVLFHRNSSAVVKTSDTIAPSDDIQKRALADAQLQPCHYDFAAGKPSAFASGGQMCPYVKRRLARLAKTEEERYVQLGQQR